MCVICDEAFYRTSPLNITESIFGSHNPDDVTLLTMHGDTLFRFGHLVNQVNAMMQRTFWLIFRQVSKDAYHHTELIKHKVNSSDGKNWTSVALMMRTEWFVIRKQERILQDMKHCLADIKAAIGNISQNTSNEVLLALDVEKFGSGSFEVTKKHHKFSTELITCLDREVKDVSLLYNK